MLSDLIPNPPSRFPRTIRWLVAGVVVVVGIGVATSAFLFTQPKVISPVGASLGIMDVSNAKPVAIIFSHWVDQNALKHEIFPELKGTWQISSSLFSGQATLTFTPLESPNLDTRYTIALSGIKSIMGGKQENYLLSFQTDSLPTVTSLRPADAAIDVYPDAPIVFVLDKPLSDALDFSVALTPAVVLEQPQISGNTITLTHAEQFQKGTTYELRAFLSTAKVDYSTNTRTVREEKTQYLGTGFTTIAAPGIAASSPSGTGVDPAATVRIEFRQAMEQASTQAAFSLAPAAAGTFTWENDRTMVFTPAQPLAKDQQYTATLANTATAASGLTLEAPYSFSFTTLGPVGVVAFAPSNGATSVKTSTVVRVGFNQDVVHASAESKLSIAPSVAGSFSWDGNTMIFHPNAALAYYQSYTATVGAGVQTVKGLDSVSTFSAVFTTESQSVMLNVPVYAQAHTYSCMIAAARGALAYRGVAASETDIIARTGVDTTPWSGTWAEDGAVWGDPDQGIVGDLDGKADNIGWGYGSHWAPIAKALSSYGILNEVRTGMTVQDLAGAIAQGNPVIIWWVNGVWPAFEVRWETPTGKQVRGVNSLHVQVVRGFTGTVENPISFTVTDSGYGYPGRTFDLGTFKAKWGWFGNTGIIVK